jgi:peptidyl-prolyl cis-trans isomerase D
VGGDTVASVGSARISQAAFDKAIKDQLETYRAQFGANFDAALMDRPEIRQGVLDRVVNEQLVALAADRTGIRVGDRQLAERIMSEPAFQEDGKFSKARYDAIARAQGWTPKGLDERLRDEMQLNLFRESIGASSIVPRATLDAFIRLSEQSREVSVITVGPDAFLAGVKVAEPEIEAYYKSNAAEFTIPEQVRVEYVSLSLDALAAKLPAEAQDVQAFYESNKARFVQPEERRASHILLTLKPDGSEAEKKAAEDKAEAILKAVRARPASFADVAKKESQDPGSASQGGDLGFFRRGAMVKAFEDAAFAAKKDEIVGPVRSEFGIHVIRVADVKPEKGKSLAEATPEIEAEVRRNLASRRFPDVAESLINGVYEQSTALAPTAERLGLPLAQSPWFSKAAPGPVFGNPKLLAEIFSDEAIKAKRNTAAIEVQPGVLVSARVIEHKPAELRPLETVKAGIEQKLRRDAAMRLAVADGEAKLKAAREGREEGLKWPAPLAVNRQKPGGLQPPVLERAFRVDAGKLPAIDGVSTPMGYSLVKVTKVMDVDRIDESRRKALSDQLRQTLAAAELESTLATLRSRIGVSVRTDLVEKAGEAKGAPAR